MTKMRCGCGLFLAMMVVCVSLDLVTKSWIFADRGMPGESPPIWIWQGVLGLETSLNEGALFGLGQGWGVLFVALSFVAIFGIFYWVFLAGAAADRLLCFALGAITGGILGNLYDRLGWPGLTWPAQLKPGQLDVIGTRVYAVRDFIHFQCPWFDWPIFNLADSFLVCGVGLLIFHAYVLEPRRMGAQQEPARETVAAS